MSTRREFLGYLAALPVLGGLKLPEEKPNKQIVKSWYFLYGDKCDNFGPFKNITKKENFYSVKYRGYKHQVPTQIYDDFNYFHHGIPSNVNTQLHKDLYRMQQYGPDRLCLIDYHGSLCRVGIFVGGKKV